MHTLQNIPKELNQEATITRQFLELVPFDNVGYRPNDKSEELIRLAVHVAEIHGWVKSILTTSWLDFTNFSYLE